MFHLKSLTNTIQISEDKLLGLLIDKFKTVEDRKEFEVLTNTYFNHLFRIDVEASNITIKQFFYAGLLVGYFYRIFLEKNEVTFVDDSQKNISE